MRFYLISDNADTLVGMRLAGIEGELLITHRLCELCEDFITQTKRSYDKPLIVEIPDRHGSQGSDSITRYVRDTIGIKI